MTKNEVNDKINEIKQKAIIEIRDLIDNGNYEVNFDVLEEVDYAYEKNEEEIIQLKNDLFKEMNKVDKLKHEVKQIINIMQNDVTNFVLSVIEEKNSKEGE